MAVNRLVPFETQSLTQNIEFPMSGIGATGLSIDTTHQRSGSACLKCIPQGTSTQSYLQRTLSSSHSQYVQLHLEIGTNPNAGSGLIHMADSNQVSYMAFIKVNTDGSLSLWYSASGTGTFTQIGSNSSVLNSSAYNTVDLHIDDSAGLSSVVIEARLNGVVFATYTGAIYSTGVGSVANGISSVGCNVTANAESEASSGTWYIDDMVYSDGSGSNITGYMPDGKIIRLSPNAAGDVNTFATQTGGTAGSANNYTRVNETTPDDATTYNGSSTLNQEDLLKCGASGIGSSDTVNAVQVVGRYRNSTADATGAFKFEIEKAASSTIAQGAAIVPNSTTWTTVSDANSIIEYKDPTGANWTQSTLDTMQIGYKQTVAPGTGGRRNDITSVAAYVHYTPVTITTKTQGGIARITALTTKLQSAVGRITAKTTKTITGVARITGITTKTQTALSRITNSVTKTIAGLARITITTTKTIASVSRITAITVKTIAGIANIASGIVTTTKTITAIARITIKTLKTQTAITRITALAIKTTTGISRITATTLKTITAVARITVTTLKNQSAIARVTVTTNKTITSVTRITKIVPKTITGIARLTASTLRTIPAIARLTAKTTKTITAISRLTVVSIKTVIGIAKITVITSKAITGITRITAQVLKTIPAISRLTATTKKTLVSISRITIITNKIITCLARIAVINLRNIVAKANIMTRSLKTITGIGRINKTTQQAMTGVATIKSAYGLYRAKPQQSVYNGKLSNNNGSLSYNV